MARRTTPFRWLLAALLIGIVGMISTSILAAPQPDSRMAVSLKNLPDVSGHPIPGDMTPKGSLWKPATKIWVVRDSQVWRALSNRSTHRGCDVEWMPDRDRLEDVCSGAGWDRSNKPVYGPAPRGLDEYPVTLEGHHLIIDLGRPIIDRRR